MKVGGNMLKDQRKEKKMSQNELSKLSGVNPRMIQFYEQEKKNINGAKLATLISLSNALDCRIRDILTDDDLKKQCEKAKL